MRGGGGIRILRGYYYYRGKAQKRREIRSIVILIGKGKREGGHTKGNMMRKKKGREREKEGGREEGELVGEYIYEVDISLYIS